MIGLDRTLPKSFRDSPAWKSSHELTLAVYQVTHQFPRLETFGLVHELRRSAAGVGASIADAFGRNSWGELRRLTQNAAGCLEETKNFLLLSADLGFLQREECERLLAIADKTSSLISDMERRPQQDLFQH
ncbi:MAG: four helix bundle protein [Acidobacteria bacterium]|nr:four helix bundle protein [Acidobacteriota bacterium]